MFQGQRRRGGWVRRVFEITAACPGARQGRVPLLARGLASTGPGASFEHGDPFMQAIASKVHRFLASEDGPTAVEYAVMLALILVAVITIVQTLGITISSTFNKVNTTLSTANG